MNIKGIVGGAIGVSAIGFGILYWKDESFRELVKLCSKDISKEAKLAAIKEYTNKRTMFRKKEIVIENI